MTRVAGRPIKVVAWYDNEWGFSHRVIDTLETARERLTGAGPVMRL